MADSAGSTSPQPAQRSVERPATPTAMVITLVVHAAIACSMILLVYYNPNPLFSLFFIHLSTAHCLAVLGYIGPSRGRFWWVPSPDTEPQGVMALFIIGAVHFLGVGLQTFYRIEEVPCEAGHVHQILTTAANEVRSVGGFDASNLTANEWSVQFQEWGGCLVRAGFVLGPGGDTCVNSTDGLGCNAYGCPAAHAKVIGWAESLAEERKHSGAGIGQSDLDAVEEGCIFMKDAFFQTERWVHPWTVVERLYYIFVLLTTVGYGNTFVPTMPFSRLITSVYALVGLLIFALGGNVVEASVSDLFNRLQRLMTRLVPCGSKESDDEPFEPPLAYRIGLRLYINMIAFLVINFGGAAIFQATEESWTYYDALYHCFMTATTIGLGDLAPQSVAGRSFAIFHMCSSVVLFGSALGTVLYAIDQRHAEAKKQQMLKRQLDEKLLVTLDKDGNGVDKAVRTCAHLPRTHANTLA